MCPTLHIVSRQQWCHQPRWISQFMDDNVSTFAHIPWVCPFFLPIERILLKNIHCWMCLHQVERRKRAWIILKPCNICDNIYSIFVYKSCVPSLLHWRRLAKCCQCVFHDHMALHQMFWCPDCVRQGVGLSSLKSLTVCQYPALRSILS